MLRLIQLKAGQKFNRLTIIKLDHIEKYIRPNNSINNKEFYLCQCDCGKECVVLKENIKNGNTKSCGCMWYEKHIKHKLSNTRIYKIWSHMKARCYNKNKECYNNYGARGIIMCDDWKNDFMSFYNWAIKNGYKEYLTIDRINVNGNYEASNCRWSNAFQQNQNTRKNRNITYNNETHCLSEWARILNIKVCTLDCRIVKHNWSIEKAFTTPININLRRR